MDRENAAYACEAAYVTIGEMREWLRVNEHIEHWLYSDSQVRSMYYICHMKREGYMNV